MSNISPNCANGIPRSCESFRFCDNLVCNSDPPTAMGNRMNELTTYLAIPSVFKMPPGAIQLVYKSYSGFNDTIWLSAPSPKASQIAWQRHAQQDRDAYSYAVNAPFDGKGSHNRVNTILSYVSAQSIWSLPDSTTRHSNHTCGPVCLIRNDPTMICTRNGYNGSLGFLQMLKRSST